MEVTNFNYDSIRDKLSNGMLLGITIMSIPNLASVIIRLLNIGFNLADFIGVVSVVASCIIFIFRKRIKVGYKVLALLVMLVSVNIAAYIKNGMLSVGVAHILLGVVCASLLLSSKWKYLSILYPFIVLPTFGYLYTSGKLAVQHNATEFMTDWGNWIVQLSILGMFVLASGIAIGYMVAELRKSVIVVQQQKEEMEKYLKDENNRLEVLVEERTRDLEETTKELMNSERLASLGRLVAGVAHEVNTPLGVSISAVSYLEERNNEVFDKYSQDIFSDADFIEYMKSVEDSTDIINVNLTRAADLIKRFKRISVDQATEMKSTFNIIKYANDLFLAMKHEYKNKDVKINIVGEDSMVIKSYPGVYSQLFTNLLMNSIVHGFEDSDSGNEITMSISNSDETLTIVYSDNGVGMTEEVKDKIFEPFYSTKHQKGGSGLGMHIVYNLITETLKGRIEVESAEKEGTVFTIKVPMEGADEHE